jgi:hypothetical protein
MIEYLRSFSIHDLKRLGMLRDGFNGMMNWTQNGEVVSTISLYVRLSGNDPAVMLRYKMTHTGEEVADWVKFHHQKSNLPTVKRGYWMFECQVTGNPCRMLYFHRGHFVSHAALPPGTLYKCQTHPKSYRSIGRVFGFEKVMTELSDTLRKPYGKMFYRGKPTRKTKRLMKIEERYENVMIDWLSKQQKGK